MTLVTKNKVTMLPESQRLLSQLAEPICYDDEVILLKKLDSIFTNHKQPAANLQTVNLFLTTDNTDFHR
jgi:hypothetical protein